MHGPGDFCHGCDRLLCRCGPETDDDAHFESSYQAGYDACLADGYDERPMTEWITRADARVAWDAAAGRLVRYTTSLYFAESGWRRYHASADAYRGWFERWVGHDLRAYLAGYDDAGAGLPPAACDAHARAAAVLDAYREPQDATQSPPEAVGADDWMPVETLR